MNQDDAKGQIADLTAFLTVNYPLLIHDEGYVATIVMDILDRQEVTITRLTARLKDLRTTETMGVGSRRHERNDAGPDDAHTDGSSRIV